MSLEGFAEALAAKRPVPGGGAAAALSLANAAALAEMVVAYSIGKKALLMHEPRLAEAAKSLSRCRSRAVALIELDAARYAELSDSLARPKDDPTRATAVRDAALGAVEPPIEVIDLAAQVLGEAADLVRRTSRSLRSDLGVSGALALAAADGGAWNVRANLPLVGERRPELERRSGTALARARDASARLTSELESIAAEGAA